MRSDAELTASGRPTIAQRAITPARPELTRTLGGAVAKLLEAVGVPAEQLRLATGAREVMRRWSLIHRGNARLLSNGFCQPWLAREADVLRRRPSTSSKQLPTLSRRRSRRGPRT
jgi:hypothetical protein